MKNLNKSLMMGAAGFYLTLIYDLVTNLGFAISFGQPYEVVLIVGGLEFMIIHVFTNTLFFGTLGPILSGYMLKTIKMEGEYTQ